MLNFLSQYGLAFSSLVPAWMNNWFAHLQVAPGLVASQTYLPPFLVSIVLGTLLGMERRKRHKVAGVRTNMLVCASACLITMVGLVIFDATKIGDPARLPGQLLAGIAFLGAGVIWKNGWRTQGLTTSAMILYATGIGIVCGFGYLLWATSAAVIIVIFMQASYFIFPPDDTGEHTVMVRCHREHFDAVLALFPTRSSVTRFTRSDNGELEFRLNVQMTLRQLNQLLSTNIHNDIIRGIEVIDESSS